MTGVGEAWGVVAADILRDPPKGCPVDTKDGSLSESCRISLSTTGCSHSGTECVWRVEITYLKVTYHATIPGNQGGRIGTVLRRGLPGAPVGAGGFLLNVFAILPIAAKRLEKGEAAPRHFDLHPLRMHTTEVKSA